MAMGWLGKLLRPRHFQFFNLLEQIGGKLSAAAAVFGELAPAGSNAQLKAVADRLKAIETETDQLCRQLYEALDRTFVTPIDREDLAALTRALDDVVDDMEHSAAFAALYRFEALTEPMRQLVRINIQAVGELARAVGHLRNLSAPEEIHAPTVAVHTLENEADVVYRQATAALFGEGTDGVELVRQKDMLEALENGVDRCEDAMDVIRSVLIKNG